MECNNQLEAPVVGDPSLVVGVVGHIVTKYVVVVVGRDFVVDAFEVVVGIVVVA
jgi:hypothetical protein